MKSVDILSKTDRTSWSRIVMASRFYLAPAKWQLWAYPLLSLFVFACVKWIGASAYLTMCALLSSLLSLAITFAPLAFGARHGREVEAMLPVLGWEKCTVILGYCLIAVPLMIYAPYELCSFIFDGGSSYSVAMRNLPGNMPDYKAMFSTPVLWIIGLTTSGCFITTCLTGVFRARRKRVMWGFLAVLIFYFAFVITFFIIGFVIGVHAAWSEPDVADTIDSQQQGLEFAMKIMPGIMRAYAIMCGIYFIFALTMCCRAIARRRL